MKILVFVKETWDKNYDIESDELFPGEADDKSDVMTNNYDKHAIEAALKIKEGLGECEVTAVSLCSEIGDKVLKEAIAMGCDKAIRIDNEEAQIMDSFKVAKILASAVEKVGEYDLVLFGMQSYDLGTATVPPVVSEFLNLPYACWVEHVEFQNGKVEAKKVIEGGNRHVRLQMPAILSIASSGDYEEPRYTSVRRIMAASRTEIPVWTIDDDLSVDVDEIKGKVEMDDVEEPPARDEECVVFKDEDISDMVDKLLAVMKEKGMNLFSCRI